MAICVHHNCYVSEQKGSICSRCKSCKHKSWTFRQGVYSCNNCYQKTTKKPDGEIWEVYEGKWRMLPVENQNDLKKETTS